MSAKVRHHDPLRGTAEMVRKGLMASLEKRGQKEEHEAWIKRYRSRKFRYGRRVE